MVSTDPRASSLTADVRVSSVLPRETSRPPVRLAVIRRGGGHGGDPAQPPVVLAQTATATGDAAVNSAGP